MKRKVLVLMATVAVAAVLIVTSTHAFNPQPDPPGKWGMAGITHMENARISLVSDASGDCTIALGFLDSDGMLIKGELRVLRQGHAAFLDVMGSQIVMRGESRAEIRPFLQDPAMPVPSGFPPDPCRNFSANLEVYERGSGKTSFLVPAVQRLSTVPITAAGQ